jgi:hypothetical protein
MGMKLFCTVSKKLMCWKLSHETPTGTSLSVAHQVLHVLISEKEKKEVGCVIV